MECSAPYGTSVSHLSSQEEGFFEEEGGERVEESEAVDELKEAMISGHNTAVPHKTS